jgi:hypothetical protein
MRNSNRNSSRCWLKEEGWSMSKVSTGFDRELALGENFVLDRETEAETIGGGVIGNDE